MEEENPHIINVLRQAIRALKQDNSLELKALSNQTIHCASCMQDSGSITIAVLNYALGKILERNQHTRIKNWTNLVKKISLYYEVAAKELEKGDVAAYEHNVLEARRTLTGISDIKQAIKDVLQKASINKASKIYEHGISLGQTANLLGVTQWELSEYSAQSTTTTDKRYTSTVDVRQRAAMALEFFS